MIVAVTPLALLICERVYKLCFVLLRVRASRRHVRAPEQRNTSVARAEVACQSVPHARVRVFSLLYVHIHTRTRTQTCAHTGMRKHVGVARAACINRRCACARFLTEPLCADIHTRGHIQTQTCAHTGMRKHVGVARAEAARKLLHDAVDLLRLARQPELGQKNSIARNILE